MADSAQVSSVDAIEAFRASLVIYLGKTKPALEQVSAEVLRTRVWVQNTQKAYWEHQLKLRRRKLEEARSIELPELREARIQDLRKQFREPALRHLHAGAFVDPTGFPNALIAFYDGSLDEALEAARRVFQARPWFYEAKQLEGEILLAKARASQDRALALAALTPATEAFLAAERVAPSDASPYLGEARVWLEVMNQQATSGQELTLGLAACRKAAAKAAMVAPRSAAPPAVLSQALGDWGRRLNQQGQDATDALREALQLTDQALALDPMSREAHVARASVARHLGHNLMDLSQDPSHWLQVAIANCQWLLARDPGDVLAMEVSRGAFTILMGYETSAGLPPWESFEGLLKLDLRTLGLHPGMATAHRSLGYAWCERAEYERRYGLDPLPSAAEAGRQFDLALAANATDYKAFYGLGNVRLIEAQQAFALGQDPRPSATKAIEHYQHSLALNPGNAASCGVLAESYLLLGEAALAQNLDPGGSFQLASGWLDRGLGMNPRSSYLWLRRGQLELLHSRWARGQVQAALPRLRFAQEAFRKALVEAPGNAEAMAGLAEGHAFLARLEPARWRAEVIQGQAWVAKGLLITPRNADLYRVAGTLADLKASHTGKPGDVQEAREQFRRALKLNRNLERMLAPQLRAL